MNNYQLQDLKKALLFIKRTGDIDCVSMETVDKLLDSIRHEMYANSIKNFRQGLDKLMPAADASEEALEAFYNMTWTIMFGVSEVQINNCASIYNAMTEFLDEYISDEL